MPFPRFTDHPSPITHHPSSIIRLVPLALCCLALAGAFWGLLQLDLPLIRFMRSVHLAWLEQAGDWAGWLGSGAVLAGLSALMLAAGFLLKRSAVAQAGLQGLIAHGIAALLVQGVKHSIGRPRPRMTHAGEFQISPSWESGFDSFPSGHAAAAFAVASVIARRLPATAWLAYGLAAGVAVSRVVRGSHFPSDVLAGTLLGCLVGYVVARPLRDWRRSLDEALLAATPYVVGAFALVWTVTRASPDEATNQGLVAGGLLAIAIGMGSRLYEACRPGRRFLSLPEANIAIGIGLALTTASLLATALAVLAGLARWLVRDRMRTDPASSGTARSVSRSLPFEGALLLLLLLAVLSIQGVKGLLPLL
ncbi:MAG: phosphatase PAP2 family protein [Nitrospirota bacterium]